MSDFQIPLLSTFVGFLADIMRVSLEFCYKFTNDMGFPSYGIAIIVLTVIIKTLLLPFALKQIKSMKAMQEIQLLLMSVDDEMGRKTAHLSNEQKQQAALLALQAAEQHLSMAAVNLLRAVWLAMNSNPELPSARGGVTIERRD